MAGSVQSIVPKLLDFAEVSDFLYSYVSDVAVLPPESVISLSSADLSGYANSHNHYLGFPKMSFRRYHKRYARWH